MTVIEREQVREVVAPVTETERRARVLEAAALEIEVRGWTKGTLLEGAGGSVCLVGALVIASGGPGDIGWYCTAAAAWRTDDSVELWGFNDRRAKSAEDVSFVLRWRAAELRDGWDA